MKLWGVGLGLLARIAFVALLRVDRAGHVTDDSRIGLEVNFGWVRGGESGCGVGRGSGGCGGGSAARAAAKTAAAIPAGIAGTSRLGFLDLRGRLRRAMARFNVQVVRRFNAVRPRRLVQLRHLFDVPIRQIDIARNCLVYPLLSAPGYFDKRVGRYLK